MNEETSKMLCLLVRLDAAKSCLKLSQKEKSLLRSCLKAGENKAAELVKLKLDAFKKLNGHS